MSYKYETDLPCSENFYGGSQRDFETDVTRENNEIARSRLTTMVLVEAEGRRRARRVLELGRGGELDQVGAEGAMGKFWEITYAAAGYLKARILARSSRFRIAKEM